MGEKRKRSAAFQVGPENLPDGTRKRKADRIKQALIDRAKIKQEFAKVKKRRQQEEQESELPRRNVYEDLEEDEQQAAVADPVSAGPHPDRQALIDGTAEPAAHEADREDRGPSNQRWRKQDPYARHVSHAQEQKEEVGRRRQERETADQQRQQRIREREKMQRMIKRAKRPTMDGKRKLGRESGFLLEKVKQMMKT